MEYKAKENLDIQEKYSNNYNNFLVKILNSNIRRYNCNSILDFGCADGFFLKKLLQYNKNKINVYGIDTDVNLREECKKNNITAYESINKINTTFDMIYMFNVLEHIEDDNNALKEIIEKLNDNGVFIVYVPAFMFVYSSLDKKAQHYRRYTLKELKQKLENTGFEIKQIEYCDSLGIIASILYKLKDKILNDNNGEIKIWQVKIYDFVHPLSRLLDKLFFSKYFGKNIFAIAQKRINNGTTNKN